MPKWKFSSGNEYAVDDLYIIFCKFSNLYYTVLFIIKSGSDIFDLIITSDKKLDAYHAKYKNN